MDERRGGDLHLAAAGFVEGTSHGDDDVVARGGAQCSAHGNPERHTQELQQVARRFSRRRVQELSRAPWK